MTRARTLALLVLVFALHVALALRFEPASVVFGPDPIAAIDYDTHYEQTVRALEAMRESGRTWAYDPHLLAGSVSGAIFDADTKAHELFTIALARLGVPPHRGYNLYILLAHLLCAPILFAAARLFRLTLGAQTLATALGSAIWYFDAFSHWVFWVGMISYGLASLLCVLAIALAFRWLAPAEEGGRRPLHLGALAGLLALVHHVHPYSFFVLVVPLAALYVRAWKTLSRGEHAGLVAAAALTVVANAWWLAGALAFWHYILDSSFYLDATPAYLVYDWLGFLKEPSTTGVLAARTAFRTVAMAAGVGALLSWRRAGDRRYGALAIALGVLFGAAYFGGLLAPLRQVQPYRFALPAMYLAAIPAAAFLVSTLAEVRSFPRAAQALFVVAAVVLAPRLIRDALYFLPEWVPRHTRALPAPPPNINSSIAFGAIQWPEPFDFSHGPIGPDAHDIAKFVREHDDGKSRWLVEWWMLGERLAWATDAQILGGFRELNLAHSDANFFRRHEHGDAPERDELRRYLDRYNVGWVVVTNPTPAIELRTDLLELVTTVHYMRVYRTRRTPSWFEGDPRNAAATVRARTNHLEVRGATGGDLVLRYHWMETLACRPGCTIDRAMLEGWPDRVGFLRVRGAPADFEVYNSYVIPKGPRPLVARVKASQ